ncbi:MAG TPA: ATP-binding protein [Methanocella sp.]|nr:ATP-binding protein [Methanocella sp.]
MVIKVPASNINIQPSKKSTDDLTLLKRAIDSTGDAVLITGIDDRILWASKPFYDRFLPEDASIIGKSRREILDRQANAFKDPRLFREYLGSLLDRPLEKGGAEWELTGTSRLIHMRSYPVNAADGELTGRVEIYREEEPEMITCRTGLDIVDTIPVGILAVDERLNIISYNRAAADFIDDRLGFTPEELKTLEALGTDHPLTRSAIKSLSDGKSVHIIDYNPAAGQDIYFDLTATPLSEPGRIYGAAITIADSTGRHKELEKALKSAKDTDFFINLMSHDIRNFNQVTMGYLEMLELSENLSEDERSYLAKSLSGVVGSNKLIENVRKVRAVQESGDQNLSPTDLSKVLRDDIDFIKSNHKGPGIKINANIPADCKIVANQYIHEVFRHILENAIKYDQHPEKAIDLEVKDAKADGQDCWNITIADRGPGIPEDRRQAIFERIGQTTRGAGIGLSMVKLIVLKHGGRIWIENRVAGDLRQGSRFVVQFRKA